VADAQSPSLAQRFNSLTERERQVALLVERGLGNKDIAEELSISYSSVKTHLGKVAKKLGVDYGSSFGGGSRTRIRIATVVSQIQLSRFDVTPRQAWDILTLFHKKNHWAGRADPGCHVCSALATIEIEIRRENGNGNTRPPYAQNQRA
jgi:hypothetical protein